jgi:hypothetical protein
MAHWRADDVAGARHRSWPLARPPQAHGLFVGHVVKRSGGNPQAIADMLDDSAKERRVDKREIRELRHAAGARHFDLTPAVIVALASMAGRASNRVPGSPSDSRSFSLWFFAVGLVLSKATRLGGCFLWISEKYVR